MRHGMRGTPTWLTWIAVRRRCEYFKHEHYAYYGGRGIKVCDRWRKFENFFADMGERPSTKHSIDRIDGNGHYEPGNCRWATRKEQAANQRFPARERTHCKRGHPLFGENLSRLANGHRRCRTCANDHAVGRRDIFNARRRERRAAERLSTRGTPA